MFMKKIFKKKKGFTLTELIIVVAILGVLSAVAAPSIIGYIDDARENADDGNAVIIENIIQRRLAVGTLASPLVAASIGDAVDEELGAVPVVQQSGSGLTFRFTAAGRVAVSSTAGTTIP
jgi:prepilin-type N-terminal cleavage/methylation domain-containing protein